MRFTGPLGYTQDAQQFFSPARDLNLGTVTNHLGHSTTVADIIFQGIDKLLLGLEWVHISDMGFEANKQLSLGGATANSRSVRVDSVGGNRFSPSEDI